MQWEPVDVPTEIIYKFAWEMAIEGVFDAYMTGESQSYIPFTQRQVLRMLDEFTRERRLSAHERLEIRSWIESLPWIGWADALPPPARDPDDEEEDVGGLIELHFNW